MSGPYDVRTTPAQAKALGDWAFDGEGAADLLVGRTDDGRLTVWQGDDMRVFHADGSDGTDEYVAQLDAEQQEESNGD